MTYQHRQLAAGRWQKLTLVEQLANVGCEVERTISWRTRNPDFSRRAFERALELIDLTLMDEKNWRRGKEIARVRETLVDYFAGDNIWQSSDQQRQQYFHAYTYAARMHR